MNVDTWQLVLTILASMVPSFEGRYAIPVAIGMGMAPAAAYILCVICSTIPMPFVFLLLRRFLDWLYTMPIGFLRKFAAFVEHKGTSGRQKMVDSKDSGVQAKLKDSFTAETLEMIGLYIFVAVPLPGTGVWTGSMIATLFELPRGKSAIAITLGNITACLITTLISTGVFAAVR